MMMMITIMISTVKGFDPGVISRLSMIVRVNVVLNRTVVVDSDYRFDNLCGSHLQISLVDSIN